HEVAGAVAPPRSSPGLSHFAPLVPTRADVARFTQRHLDAGFDVDPRDHVVSQSCYVTDPDGHTIEATWACPQEQWQWTEEGLPIVVATPIAVQDLLTEPGANTPAPLPAETQMGHVQLKVTDAALSRTKQFYCDLLGLQIYARLREGFIGVGVADYRSLLVCTNRFSPHGGTPAGPDTARLTRVDLLLTAPETIGALAERLAAAGHPHQHTGSTLTTHDPSGNPLRFSIPDAGQPPAKPASSTNV
uniref:VOC family protein n=1 Tax=Amycolatopsis sp. CA-126428 TaxID=2073158 RepID=UPI001E2D9C09